MRGMGRGLLPSENKPTDEEADAQGASMTKALQVPPFGHVLPAADGAKARKGDRSAIVAACTAFDLPPKSVMVVSGSSAVLQAARQAGSYSLHLVKRAPGAPNALPSDFRADDCDGIKEAIEELNGITFRDPDTEIRTKYGVSVT